MQKSKFKMTIQNSKLNKKEGLFSWLLVLIFLFFFAFQIKSQDLPPEILEEMEKREIFNCEEIPYGELLNDTEAHFNKFLPLLIDLKDKAKAVFPAGLKIIDLAGDCRCEYCQGKCQCEEKDCVRVRICKRLDECLPYKEEWIEADIRCIEGNVVHFRGKMWGVCIGGGDNMEICTGPLLGLPGAPVEQCGKCCCDSDNYFIVDHWTSPGGIETTVYNIDCQVPAAPPSACRCQKGEGPDVCQPGEYCDGCNCKPGPPPPEIPVSPPPGGGGGTPSLCEPKPCQGNPCLMNQFGKDLIGKDKEKEDFKKALEKLRLLERELDQLWNAAYRIEDLFGVWYRNRQTYSLFDCYTLKDMELPEGPKECPFGGNDYFYCY